MGETEPLRHDHPQQGCNHHHAAGLGFRHLYWRLGGPRSRRARVQESVRCAGYMVRVGGVSTKGAGARGWPGGREAGRPRARLPTAGCGGGTGSGRSGRGSPTLSSACSLLRGGRTPGCTGSRDSQGTGSKPSCNQTDGPGREDTGNRSCPSPPRGVGARAAWPASSFHSHELPCATSFPYPTATPRAGDHQRAREAAADPA